jgi:hypothetical protein
MKKILLIVIIAIHCFSCKKFLDVNTTPNNPVSAPAATLLPSTTIGIAFANSNDANRATSALVQHIAGVANQTLGYDLYNLDGSFDNTWSLEIYGNTINNLQILIDQNATANPAYSGIAKLEMAYAFSLATDLWGDVPYSQAGQGLKFKNPRFDKQEDIYQGNTALEITSLFDLVKSGIADLAKPSILKPGADDLVYKGDLTKWVRMGNTLLLKFAIQISNRNPALAKSTIQAVIDGNNYINSNALDFEVGFANAVGNQNPIFSFNNVNRSGDQMLSARLLALSKSLNDTVRLAKYFTKSTGAFVAFNNGATTTAPALATRSKYHTYLTADPSANADGKSGGSAPIRLLTNFQVQFILAEAALILGTSGIPNDYYQAGIKANMQKIGMTEPEIQTYFLGNPNVVILSGTPQKQLEQIMTQKYISWIGNGIEAFNDYRRTRFPPLALVLNAAGDNPNVIPERLPYTLTELSTNPLAPKPRPKTDVKVWWAK